MLGLNIERYSKEKKFYSFYDMQNMLPALKKNPEYEWLKESPSQGLQQKCQDLYVALMGTSRKKENRKGFPKFKSRYTDYSGIRFSDWKIDGDRIYLPKQFKKDGMKIVIDRPFLGETKTITVYKDNIDHYYVSFTVLVDDDFIKPQIDFSSIPETRMVGIDVGIKNFVSLSDGTLIKNPKYLYKQEKKLKRYQRMMTRKQKGSSNRKKARYRLSKLHKRVANQRKDFIRQTVVDIVKSNDFIGIEDLNIKGMVKNHHLAKSLSDTSLGMLLNEIQWQCKKRGKICQKINRFFASSKTCSVCGWKKENLKLSDRVFRCECCGHTLDRDFNASYNILAESLRLYKEQNIPLERRKSTTTRYDYGKTKSE